MVALRRAHRDWRKRRGLDPAAHWPSERYVLLHTLSHALINELALECGYSAASIRERIYAEPPGGEGPPMAGILLYTAAPDAEGTLGGLVNLGRPEFAGPVLTRALRRMGLCTSDPTCANHCPGEQEDVLHGAACHACLFVPETSCERGNRYLERGALCGTLAGAGIAFLEAWRAMPADDPLAVAVQRAATELPIGQLHKLADAFSKHEGPTAVARHGIVNRVPTAMFRHFGALMSDSVLRLLT